MQGSKLYVGNLSYSVAEQELQGLFATYGEIKQITIISGKGFGFVEMVNAEDAEKAKNALNGTEFQGRQLKIDEARPMRDKNKGNYKRY